MKASEALLKIAEECYERPLAPAGAVIQSLILLREVEDDAVQRAHEFMELFHPSGDELRLEFLLRTTDINYERAAAEYRLLVHLFAAAMAEAEGD